MKIDRNKIKSKFGGKCAYCGCDLGKTFHIDHIVPMYRNCSSIEYQKLKDVEENMNPACPRCNRWKSVLSLESFRKDIEVQIERLNRYNANYRLAKDYGLIQEIPKKIIFWFEKYDEQPKESKDANKKD